MFAFHALLFTLMATLAWCQTRKLWAASFTLPAHALLSLITQVATLWTQRLAGEPF